MTPNQIKQKVLAYKDWEWWAERPHAVFIVSLYSDGQNREYIRRAGVDAQWPANLFQKGCYYKSPKVLDDFGLQLNRYLKSGGSVFKVVEACEKFEKSSKKKIPTIIKA